MKNVIICPKEEISFSNFVIVMQCSHCQLHEILAFTSGNRVTQCTALGAKTSKNSNRFWSWIFKKISLQGWLFCVSKYGERRLKKYDHVPSLELQHIRLSIDPYIYRHYRTCFNNRIGNFLYKCFLFTSAQHNLQGIRPFDRSMFPPTIHYRPSW